MTFHWPRKLNLVASGRQVDAGPEGKDRQFERRRLALPASGFSFEVGKFDVLTRRAGHVALTLATDSLSDKVLDRKSQQEILDTVAESLAYFEEVFGPYPLDELVVVSAPRDFSQSFLGFITLSTLVMLDPDRVTLLLGLEDRRSVVAHEVAHQWWGNMVPWQGYRDQWISEAAATYAAVLYARNRFEEPTHLGPTHGWQSQLTEATDDGRPIESLGPLVLGERLVSSRAGNAYQPIVYKKGAVVLEMLSRIFTEEKFLEALRSLVAGASFRPISTEIFIETLERLTGTDLGGFARQFIFGTGLPEVYYTYELEKTAADKWSVHGSVRQESPYRYRYRVVRRDGGGFDVLRERLDQIEVADSILVVPVQLMVYDPALGKTPDDKTGKLDPEASGNLMLNSRVVLRGASTRFHLEVEHEPKELWLDLHRQVFGRFFNERRYPKRMLLRQGLAEHSAGRYEAAERLYREALAAEALSGPARAARESRVKKSAQYLDGRIHSLLTRLYLDQGRVGEARDVLERYGKRFRGSNEELKLLKARLAIHEGDSETAYELLRKAILRRGELGSPEGLSLLAVAAYDTGHEAAYVDAAARASERGADLTALGFHSSRGETIDAAASTSEPATDFQS